MTNERSDVRVNMGPVMCMRDGDGRGDTLCFQSVGRPELGMGVGWCSSEEDAAAMDPIVEDLVDSLSNESKVLLAPRPLFLVSNDWLQCCWSTSKVSWE